MKVCRSPRRPWCCKVACPPQRGGRPRCPTGIPTRCWAWWGLLLRDVARSGVFEQHLRTADRLTSLGTLAAGVAHEVNNPLAYIIGNIQFALEVLKGGQG